MNHDYQVALAALQNAIIENQPSEAIDLLGRKTPSLTSRLEAYIQGYRIRLCSAVEADYPTLAHYLGEEKLRQYIADYVEETPSKSYTIDQYPPGFAAYLSMQMDDQAAIDIAALEAAISQVFWMTDSEPFIPTADFSMEQLATLTLEHRNASMLLKFATNADIYLTDFRQEKETSADHTASHLMIIRHDNEVKRHRLDATEYALLLALKEMPFAEALESVGRDEAHATTIATHLSEWLMKWITHGFFRDIADK